MSSGFLIGVPMSMAMITSTFMLLPTSIGMLLTTMPSTRALPSMTTGAKKPGIAMLADMALGRLPELRTTSSPVPIAVATARKGIARSSKSRSCRRPG